MRTAHNAINLIGRRFGRLLVTAKHPVKIYNGCVGWECLCDCGNRIISITGNLRSGNTISCGCHRVDFAKTVFEKYRTTHGHSRHPLFKTYTCMLTRCDDPRNNQFHNYGARGITVCERWRNDFMAFVNDMGERPDGMTLDRIDGSKNYEPGNCRWATDVEQANNSRRNRVLEFNGKRQTLAQWGKEYGLRAETISQRIDRNGWTVERAITTPIRK